MSSSLSRQALPLASLAALAAACVAPSTSEAVATDESAVSTVSGASIQSAYVDPGKTYLRRRSVRNLGVATALDRAAIELADRVDGVLANKPRDGFVTIDELVAMEQPAQAAVLFPQEKASLPRIWEALEVGPLAPVVSLAGAPAGDRPLKERITTALTRPSAVVPAAVSIASLAYDLRTVAARVQLAYDADGDPSTIAPADVAAAKANPAPFTSAELKLVDRIALALRAAGSATASAKLVVPYDGVRDERYGKAGRFEIVRSRRLVLEETRSIGGAGALDVQLDAEETVRDRLLFDGTEAIAAFFSTTTDDEFVVGPLLGDAITRIPAGRYLVQVWDRPGMGPSAREGSPCATDGQAFERTCGRCGHMRAVCSGGEVSLYGACTGEDPTCAAGAWPAKTPAGWFEVDLGQNHPAAYVSDYQRTVKLRDFVDYEVVTEAGAPVAKWLGYAVTNGHKAQWTYGPFDPDHVGNKELSPPQMAALETPKLSLPVGTYRLDAELGMGDGLEVYPNGVVLFVTSSGTRRLVPVGGSLMAAPASNQEPAVALDTRSGALSVTKPYGSTTTVTLDGSKRE